jgi:hypothetical protein
MAPTNKQENVVAMIKSFGEMLRDMPDGVLKKNFSAFVYQLTFGNKSLPEMLEMLDTKIGEASTSSHQDLDVNAKSTVKFWKNIYDMLLRTYNANKE